MKIIFCIIRVIYEAIKINWKIPQIFRCSDFRTYDIMVQNAKAFTNLLQLNDRKKILSRIRRKIYNYRVANQ